MGHLTGLTAIPALTHDEASFGQDRATYAADFADIMGREHVKRALEVAAAGGIMCSCLGQHMVAFSLWARLL